LTASTGHAGEPLRGHVGIRRKEGSRAAPGESFHGAALAAAAHRPNPHGQCCALPQGDFPGHRETRVPVVPAERPSSLVYGRGDAATPVQADAPRSCTVQGCSGPAASDLGERDSRAGTTHTPGLFALRARPGYCARAQSGRATRVPLRGREPRPRRAQSGAEDAGFGAVRRPARERVVCAGRLLAFRPGLSRDPCGGVVRRRRRRRTSASACVPMRRSLRGSR
jgi:hypothetical protein